MAIVEVNECTILFVALNTCIRYPVAFVPLQLYVALLVILLVPVSIQAVCHVLATNHPVHATHTPPDNIVLPVQGFTHTHHDNTNPPDKHGSIQVVCQVSDTSHHVQSTQIHHESICNIPVHGFTHTHHDNTNHPLKHGSIQAVCHVLATNHPVQSTQLHHESICNVPVQGFSE